MACFKTFAAAVRNQFNRMSSLELFRVGIDGLDVWAAYLAAFPEGTNPIYRVRTEHDGSYDRNFVRKLGNVVAVDELGKLYSIWSAYGDLEYPYNEVCQAMDELVCNQAIASVFRHDERQIGFAETTERLDDGQIKTWNHFHAAIKPAHCCSSPAKELGEINSNVAVMERGFKELKVEAVDTVLSLIDDNNLYRGSEFRKAVAGFRDAQRAWSEAKDRNTVLWTNHANMAGRIRNTAIGSLLVDLSDGVDIERAVNAFETKVAPTNYKRPTSLITPRMVEDAMATIAELELEPALERRLARIGDISINDVLWADNTAQSNMRGPLGDVLLASAVARPGPKDTVVDIAIEDFVRAILPKATQLSVMMKNSHQRNLVTLTAPVHAESAPLFKWDNNFAWSYNGNITDAIKERVKTAGGNIDAALRVSLAWFNHDDLDLHVHCPDGHVYFGNKQGERGQEAILDVDANAGGGRTRTPVENMAWVHPKPGYYEVRVNQYCQRESSSPGFVMEMECNGTVQEFAYSKPLRSAVTVSCFSFNIDHQGEVTNFAVLDNKLSHQGMAQGVWGVKTESFMKVSTVLNSPNHWADNAVGNKHWFFIVDGCRTDVPARGVYNEFLKPELDKHRKVFEVLGDKTKCPVVDDQLSGLGFSSTKPDTLLCRVTGPSINRLYNVRFG